MLDRKQLLQELQNLLRKEIEPDLRQRSDLPEIAEELKTEFEAAKKAERTALNYTDWRSDYITQIGAAWVLSCVFIRFLEDNQLIDPPKLSGPATTDDESQSALQRARDEYDLYIKQHPRHSFREYMLSVIDDLAKLPGGKDIFGKNNLVHQQPDWLSNDAAKSLYGFWQRVRPDTGQIIHDFGQRSADSGQRSAVSDQYDTRFLGDLYQDLSEAARKKYALLQTPDFVEEFILDRTLEPALDEFGLTPGGQESAGSGQQGKKLSADNLTADSYFKMIDPACGSGHFLLGAFPRILNRWQRQEPGTNVRELVQRTLYSIHGVDINPFAIAIARFRLLLAALRASDLSRLKDAPAFHMNLACGDSLYHGRRQQQLTLGDDWTDESHYFGSEDADNLRRILQEGTFHAVVANPPYIVVGDPAANATYRRLYKEVCHKQYSLAAPFMQRINKLGINSNTSAAYTGQITANSFMNNEFGTKLVETYLPTIDLTHIVDTRYLQPDGHETPTVILFGRARPPVDGYVRVVRGIKGESPVPTDLSTGQVWTSILQQIDLPGSGSEFASVCDTNREELSTHPWSIGGGGASEVYEYLVRTANTTLRVHLGEIGRTTHTGENPAFYLLNGTERTRGWSDWVLPVVSGEDIRDWLIKPAEVTIFPYDHLTGERRENMPITLSRHYWLHRATLRARQDFGDSIEERGLQWTDHSMFFPKRHRHTTSVAFAFKATHNHFALNDRRFVFNQTAPVIQLRDGTREDYCELREILNSSVTSLWEREVHREVSGKREERWQGRLERNTGKLKDFPLPEERPRLQSSAIELNIAVLAELLPCKVVQAWADSGREDLAGLLDVANHSANEAIASLIRLQEDLDWECYRLYGLLEDDLTYKSGQQSAISGHEERLNTVSSFGIHLGERAFEIVLARKMQAGEVSTTWFSRHGSTPITELPSHWPDDYKQLVQRRIEVIESDPSIALIEQPEYKRRWNTEPWEQQVAKALRFWLLDRLESYFDFDGRMSGQDSPVSGQESAISGKQDTKAASSPPPLANIALYSVAQVADVAAKDKQFMEVAQVYRDRADFDLVILVSELVSEEHVPALPSLRYKPTGLDKRTEWEQTWDLQRKEDVISASVLSACLQMLSSVDKESEVTSDPESRSVLTHQLELSSLAEQVINYRNQFTAGDSKSDDKTKIEESLKKKLLEIKDLKLRDVQRIICQMVLGDIAVPPKYTDKDFVSASGTNYWKLRGKLDVPNERWVSFPYCQGEDQTLVIAWAGYDHLQLTRAIAAFFAEVQEKGGSEDSRLVPLLAAMDQQIPWVKQWHNEVDPEFGYRLGDYFVSFIEDEARNLSKTVDDIRNWKPPATAAKKKASKKKAAQ